jgi:hypothetical protein
MRPEPMTRTSALRRFNWLLPVAVSVVGVACNATGATPIPTRTVPPPSIAATAAASISTPVDMRGTWTADVQGTTASSGIWKLQISASNLSLQNPVGGEAFPLDPTSMTETSLVLPAGEDCPDQTVVTPGTYTLALTGNSLVITMLRDSCGDRSGVLTAAPWARVP